MEEEDACKRDKEQKGKRMRTPTMKVGMRMTKHLYNLTHYRTMKAGREMKVGRVMTKHL